MVKKDMFDSVTIEALRLAWGILQPMFHWQPEGYSNL